MLGRFRNYSIGARLTAMSVIAAILVAVPSGMYVYEIRKGLAFVREEVRGLPVVSVGMELIQAIGLHRRFALSMTSGDAKAVQEYPQRREAVEASLKKLDNALAGEKTSAGFNADRELLRKHWVEMKRRLDAKDLVGPEHVRQQLQLMDTARTVLERIGDHYQLSLDPEADTYYQIINLLKYLPEYSEEIVKLRSFASALLKQESLSEADGERVRALADIVEQAERAVISNFNKVFEQRLELKPTFDTTINTLTQHSGDAVRTARDSADPAKRSSALAKAIFASGSKAIDAQRALSKQTLDVLTASLTQREASFALNMRVLIAVVLSGIALFALLAWLTVRSITGPMRELAQAAEAIKRGQFEAARLEVARDEPGQVAQAFASVRDTISAVVQAQSDIARLHAAGEIDRFLEPERFEGAYRDLAEKVNGLVKAHIDVTFRMAEVVQHYGRGDFSVDMPELPGKQATLTRAVVDVKANLAAVSHELGRLVECAARGDFSARGNEQNYAFAYRDIVAQLNRLMQTIDASLGDANRVFGALAKGDLRERITASYDGSLATLKESANATTEQLGQLIAVARGAAGEIDTAIGQIAQGNADLSARTEQQASALEQTASAMEELTSTVRQNAESASHASRLMGETATAAQGGGETMHQVVATMSGIADSSRRIQDIIGVIDSIAFQTNILALNAAVEAARAGEQGRGFAVVAAEVRALAQRSAGAAKEIKTLITGSAGQVDAGTDLVNRAGQQMQEIVGSIQRVGTIIAEIAGASAEQSGGIEQVNQAVTSMDQTTQQNAALVEQAAAAAESMKEQAQSLVRAVAVFRLADAAAKPVIGPVTAEKEWDGGERRGPDRARNVERLAGKRAGTGHRSDSKTDSKSDSAARAEPVRAKAAGAGEWEEF